MLANYLIGLREGLEASLVVGILIAYLVKTGHRDRLPQIWTGVCTAITLSLAFGALLSFTSASLSFEDQEAFGGYTSIVAVAFVTWMIFWMRRTARFLKSEIEGKLASALTMGPVAMVGAAFICVGREGLETSVFLWAAVQSTGRTTSPLVGAGLGLLTAATLGWMFYRQAIRINLAKFFKYTGIGLVIVAAGVLAYAIHDLQEGGVLGGLNNTVFDISSTIPIDSWYGTLLKGTFNFNPAPTTYEFIVWLTYLIAVLTAFLWPQRVPVKPSKEPVRTR
jgi:high-affinity iron transporter